MMFIFQHNPFCGPHTSSMLQCIQTLVKKVINTRYDVIIWTFQSMNFSVNKLFSPPWCVKLDYFYFLAFDLEVKVTEILNGMRPLYGRNIVRGERQITKFLEDISRENCFIACHRKVVCRLSVWDHRFKFTFIWSYELPSGQSSTEIFLESSFLLLSNEQMLPNMQFKS